MANVSMWCLPANVHKEWCARYYYSNDKESYTFNGKTPSFYNMMCTQIFHKHIQQVFQEINKQFCCMN